MQETNINQQLADANQEFHDLFSSIGNEEINTIPYKDSWTPAQVARHVYKSETGMLRALGSPGKEANRDAYAGVDHIKAIFLDFTSKMKSPEMAVPEEEEYDKEKMLEQLTDVGLQLSETIPNINSSELVTGLPTGDLTKGEIVHFLLYHTKRHIHQLKKMAEAFTSKTKTMITKDEIIRKVNEAFNENNFENFLSYCTDDVSWNMLGEMNTTGKENIRKMLSGMPGESPAIQVTDIFSGEDKGICTGTFSMKKKDGEPGNFYFCDVYNFKENKIQKMDSYVVEMKK